MTLNSVRLHLYQNHRADIAAGRQFVPENRPGRAAQSVGHLTRKSEGLGSIPVWQHTFVSPSADSEGTVASYWRKYVDEILVNRLGDVSLPRESVIRLTDRPDMT